MEVTAADVARAIGICAYSRSTHVAWRDYISDGRATVEEVEVAGSLRYQESRIARYDHVLCVLRSHPLAPSDPVDPLPENP